MEVCCPLIHQLAQFSVDSLMLPVYSELGFGDCQKPREGDNMRHFVRVSSRLAHSLGHGIRRGPSTSQLSRFIWCFRIHRTRCRGGWFGEASIPMQWLGMWLGEGGKDHRAGDRAQSWCQLCALSPPTPGLGRDE